MKQLDLLDWADSRPSAVVIDANSKIQRRITRYIAWQLANNVEPDRTVNADVVKFERKRGAA